MDFGKEINGSLSITTQRTSIVRASARLVFGESVMEALSSIGEKNATNDHSVRDMVVELGMMSTMRFGEMGFRFAKVEALEGDYYNVMGLPVCRLGQLLREIAPEIMEEFV